MLLDKHLDLIMTKKGKIKRGGKSLQRVLGIEECTEI